MNKKTFVTTVCRDLIPRVMSSAVAERSDDGKVKKKGAKRSFDLESRKPWISSTKRYRILLPWDFRRQMVFRLHLGTSLFVLHAVTYCKNSQFTGRALLSKRKQQALSYAKSARKHDLGFYLFVVVLPNLFCQHMRDAKLNIQSSFAINFSCLLYECSTCSLCPTFRPPLLKLSHGT